MNHGIAKSAPILSVVLNWNGSKTLNDTLKDIVKQTVSPHRILVIDNASSDGSVDKLSTEFPGVELLRLPENIGFARGNNAVLEWEGWKDVDWKNGWLFLSNNDVLYEPDMLSLLREAGEGLEEAVSISPWIAYADPRDRLWFGGATIHAKTGYIGHRRLRETYTGKEDDGIEPTDYATACSVMMPAKYFIDAGGFDAGFPHYGEDVDLSLRLKQKYRGECYVLRKVLAYHRVSASIGGTAIKYRWRTAAQVRVLSKHFNTGVFGLTCNLFYSLLAATSRNGISGAIAAWHGWREGIRSGKSAISWERPHD